MFPSVYCIARAYLLYTSSSAIVGLYAYCISVDVTLLALQSVKTNKATCPDNIPAWVLKDHANILAAPLTAIFNSSLREGVIPNECKMATVIPLPKTKPIISVETDIRPISLTPIVAKVFESIVLGWVDDIVGDRIDDNQVGGVGVEHRLLMF